MLIADNLHVSLGRTEILHGVDVSAEPGALTVVIGPNGSGKTTLLRALTGEIAFQGAASINGYNTRKTPAHILAAQRGVLPQAASLSFPFTVFEVVRLGLTAGIHNDVDDEKRVLEALEAVDLIGFGSRFYHQLSGGEKQRVQLARALVQVWEPVFEGRPRYLFLDEPISSLDIKHQIQVLETVRDYANAGGGVFAVLHDLNLTARFADAVYLMSDGRIVARGSPETVLTEEHLSTVYGCAMRVYRSDDDGTLTIAPVLKKTG
ncbi:MAG: heme ABC transporter ATP-binding protein [Pseudomonadota bacterium]